MHLILTIFFFKKFDCYVIKIRSTLKIFHKIKLDISQMDVDYSYVFLKVTCVKLAVEVVNVKWFIVEEAVMNFAGFAKLNQRSFADIWFIQLLLKNILHQEHETAFVTSIPSIFI